MDLFRKEVLANKSQTLHGTIYLATPVSWQIITFALAAAVAVALTFLVSASYSRSEGAEGAILPEQGLLEVITNRPGRVEKLMVHEGDLVRKGAVLARVGAEAIDQSGVGTQSSVLSAIEKQEQGIADQQVFSRLAAKAEAAEIGQSQIGLRNEIRNIDAQILVQRRLIELAKLNFDSVRDVATRGFITRRDLTERETAHLLSQQQLSGLQQARAAKISSLRQIERAQRQAIARSAGAEMALFASQAQLERDRATTRGDQGYLLVAPTGGRVSGLAIHVGDTVAAQQSTMMVVPVGGRLIARLYVPGKAAGFVHPGQSVRLALDAYPHERFGTVGGIIKVMSFAPIMRSGKDGAAIPVYLADVIMADPTIHAYGRRESLLPGMTFTARIVTERRSLMQWLFDPLLAASRQ